MGWERAAAIMEGSDSTRMDCYTPVLAHSLSFSMQTLCDQVQRLLCCIQLLLQLQSHCRPQPWRSIRRRKLQLQLLVLLPAARCRARRLQQRHPAARGVQQTTSVVATHA